MKLTRAADYAVRCILYLACQEQGIVVSRREVAEAMEIPHQFLGKVAQQLARAGILEIAQGARGGYRLIRSPESLTLLEVVEVMEGEVFLNDCLIREDFCFRSGYCAAHRIWSRLRDDVREKMASANFADLAKEELKSGRRTP